MSVLRRRVAPALATMLLLVAWLALAATPAHAANLECYDGSMPVIKNDVDPADDNTPRTIYAQHFCYDANDDPVFPTEINSQTTHGTLTIVDDDVDYLAYLPDEGYVGRDTGLATFSNGTTSVQVPVNILVKNAEEDVACGSTETTAWVYEEDGDYTSYELDYLCSSDPETTIAFTVDAVSPLDAADGVSIITDGEHKKLRIESEELVERNSIEVRVLATHTNGSTDVHNFQIDVRRDPTCGFDKEVGGEARYTDGEVVLDLDCSDPNGGTLTYDADWYQCSSDATEPGALTFDGDKATFDPTADGFVGSSCYDIEVTDSNDGSAYYSGVTFRLYQEADLEVTHSTPLLALKAGTGFVVHTSLHNNGPDDAKFASSVIDLPSKVEVDPSFALPADCWNYGNMLVACDFENLADGATVGADIHLRARYGATGTAVLHSRAVDPFGNLKDTVIANDTPADIQLTITLPTTGGSGTDKYQGSTGNNTYSAGSGNDFAALGSGTDNAKMGAGNDCAQGDAGNDTIDGGAGNDKLFGGSGSCSKSIKSGVRSTRATSDNDNLKGGSGNDTLVGGAGNDKLNGGSGKDTYSGGSGSDVISARDKVKKEVIDCGRGKDTVYADKGDTVKRNCEKVFKK